MILILLNCLVILIIYMIYISLTKNCDYWKKKKVPYLPPKFLFGNYIDYIMFKRNYQLVESEICEKFPNEPYIGVFYGTKPVLIIKDPALIKLVLAQDFYYFSGRENTDYAHKEPLTKGLFFNGGDEWKVLRQNLTPLFTSAKLRNMFPLIKECVDELEAYLEEETRISDNINIKSTFAKYSMECIMNCAFGLKVNTMKRDIGINPFATVGEKIFDASLKRGLKIISRAIWPSLFYSLGFKLFDDRIDSFFNNLFTEASKNRPEGESSRNDFLELVLNWNKKSYITGDSLSNLKTGGKKLEIIEVTEELLAAQSMIFFAAGFETTSSTLNFLLYELAINKQAQARVIEEVDAYFKKYNDVIKFDCIAEMPYTESCIDETLRLYPVLGVVTREVMDDYTLPTGVRLRKGDHVHIPVYHIHRNPVYFEDPLSFRPERFFGEAKKNVKPFTFMPFGEGPRICIGNRFARMVLNAAILTLFKKYRLEPSENMPLNLKYEVATFVTQLATDVYIKVIPR